MKFTYTVEKEIELSKGIGSNDTDEINEFISIFISQKSKEPFDSSTIYSDVTDNDDNGCTELRVDSDGGFIFNLTEFPGNNNIVILHDSGSGCGLDLDSTIELACLLAKEMGYKLVLSSYITRAQSDYVEASEHAGFKIIEDMNFKNRNTGSNITMLSLNLSEVK